MEPKKILELTIDDCDLGRNFSIREYLVELLATVWREQEGFSGKRPFGNSDWYCDFNLPLVKAGVVEGKVIDEDGWESVDLTIKQQTEVADLILDLIKNHL